MRRLSGIARLSIGLLLAAAGTASSIAAQTDDFLLERTSILVGAFNSRIDTDLRVDGETLRGTSIDFEEDLDLEKDPTVGVFAISHLFGQRHQVGIGFNRVSRDRERVLTREVTFRDRVFEIGIPVLTTFETETWELNYTYWLTRKQASAFGISAGVQWQTLTSSIEARGSQVQRIEEADADLPVPLIGFSYRHLLTQRTRFLLTATFLPEVHVGDIDAGSFTSIFAAVEWLAIRNLALGVSYSLGDLSVEFSRVGLKGDLDYITEGLQLYGRVVF